MDLGINEISDVEALMRDGTILRADVFKPVGKGPWPVLLCRTPYSKRRPHYVRIARHVAQLGYVMVIQDIRGRYSSDGVYQWMFDEPGNFDNAQDGYDSVEWAARLPDSNGKVGVWGNSYCSALAWRLAGMQPPSLAAMFTSGMVARYRDMSFGIFETGRRLQWTYSMAGDTRRRAASGQGPFDGDLPGQDLRAELDREWELEVGTKWLSHLPLSELPDELFDGLASQLNDLYPNAHEEPWAFDNIHHKVEVPTACVTGWWDRLVGGVDNFGGMVRTGPAHLKSSHRLIVGPWGHNCDEYRGDIGPRDYGRDAEVFYPDLLARFFDFYLKGIANGLDNEPPAKIFVLNENRWRASSTWPPEEADNFILYLSGNGKANTVYGDGILKTTPAETGSDTFDYDPLDPVPSLISADAQAAPVDQAPNNDRNDILVYQTAPLEDDIVFVGPLSCHLFVKTDVPDTDFTAKLVEVGIDGKAINISYGIARASLQLSPEQTDAMAMGEVTEIQIKMMPVGIRFLRGSRIRLDISSSDFPNFDRNHNTGLDYWSNETTRVAHQQILHNKDYPSRIIFSEIREKG